LGAFASLTRRARLRRAGRFTEGAFGGGRAFGAALRTDEAELKLGPTYGSGRAEAPPSYALKPTDTPRH